MASVWILHQIVARIGVAGTGDRLCGAFDGTFRQSRFISHSPTAPERSRRSVRFLPAPPVGAVLSAVVSASRACVVYPPRRAFRRAGLAGRRFTCAVGEVILQSPGSGFMDRQGEVLEHGDFQETCLKRPDAVGQSSLVTGGPLSDGGAGL